MEFKWKPLEFIEMGQKKNGRKRQAVMIAYINKYRKQQEKELEELKNKNGKKDGDE